MILENIDTNVNGNVESKACKIEANPVMYDILSNRLYKNKVRAVIRELSTNAVDSHKKAGNLNTPIKVQLPTILEPSFIIRDYGTGLKEQDIYDLYMTYGASDKRDSNLFNGALGVGSKSPFAYTQAFSVTSYFGEEATTYSVFSENGSPKIAKLGSVPSTEPTGLSIEVPVDDYDIAKFTREAEYVYTFLGFPVETNFELERLFEESDTEFKGEDWAIYPDLNEAYIVMAGIGYNLKNLGVDTASILDTDGLVITVETGDVQFAASREELSLSPETIVKLKELAKTLEEGFKVKAKEAIELGTGVLEVAKITQGMPRYLRTIIAGEYPLINDSYYGNMSVKVPDDLKLSQKQSWKKSFSTIHSFPQEFIKNSQEWSVVVLDIISRKTLISEEYFSTNKKVLFISSREKKTKDNSKSRFLESLKLLGITEYNWASDYDFGTKGVGGQTTGLSLQRSTILEKTWNYHKVELGADGNYIIKNHTGALDDIDLTKADILPIPEVRGEFIYKDKRGYDSYKYNFRYVLADSLKFFDLLEVGRPIYLVGVPQAQHQTMINKGGKNWKEFFTSAKKVVVNDCSTTLNYLRRVGWDITEYNAGYNKGQLNYLPKDIEKVLTKINKFEEEGTLIMDSNKQHLHTVLDVLNTLHNKPMKLSIKTYELPNYFTKKYDIAKEGWKDTARRYTKIADISWKQIQKLDKEA